MRLFFFPVVFSELQFQPPYAVSGFLLLSEGLKSQDLVSPAVRVLPQPCSVGMFGLPPLQQRGKGEAGNLSSLPPPNNKFMNGKQNTDPQVACRGELLRTCAQPA